MAVMDTVQVSGPGKQLVALARALAERGCELRIAVFRRAGRPQSPFERYVLDHGVGLDVIPERSLFDPQIVSGLSNLLRSFKPHIIQTHGYKATVVAFILTKIRRYAIRWIAFFHGATAENKKVELYHRLDLAIIRLADRIVLMSHFHRETMRLPAEKSRVVYNAVIESTAGDGIAPRIDETERTRLLCVGRLSPEKGVERLLHALSLLPERGRFELDVVGDGIERAHLEHLTETLGLTEVVSFRGHQGDTAQYYRRADVLVIPSLSEGLPNVLLEALPFSCRIVATRVGAIPELLNQKPFAVLCNPGDEAGLARAILLGDQIDAAAASDSSRATLMHQLSVSGRAESMVRLYAETLRGSCENSC